MDLDLALGLPSAKAFAQNRFSQLCSIFLFLGIFVEGLYVCRCDQSASRRCCTIRILINTILYIIHINIIMIIMKYMLKHDFAMKKRQKTTMLYIFRYFKEIQKRYFCNQANV